MIYIKEFSTSDLIYEEFGKIIIQGRQKIKFSVLPLGAKWNTQRGNTVALYNIYIKSGQKKLE